MTTTTTTACSSASTASTATTGPHRSLPDTAPAAPAPARAVLRLLAGLRHGQLDLRLPDGSMQRFGQATLQTDGPADHPAARTHAAMHIHDWAVFQRALRAGDIGLAEGFIAGEWDSPDLTALLTLFTGNREALEQVVYGTFWGALVYRI